MPAHFQASNGASFTRYIGNLASFPDINFIESVLLDGKELQYVKTYLPNVNFPESNSLGDSNTVSLGKQAARYIAENWHIIASVDDSTDFIKVDVSFYKPSGKFAYSCIIEVTATSLHSGTLYQEIVEKQTAISKREKFEYIIVVRNVNDDDPFCNRLFYPTT
jgi:hypothetical protein